MLPYKFPPLPKGPDGKLVDGVHIDSVAVTMRYISVVKEGVVVAENIVAMDKKACEALCATLMAQHGLGG